MIPMLLTDVQGHKIEHRLPRSRGYRGRPYAQSRRLTIEAILWIACTGSSGDICPLHTASGIPSTSAAGAGWNRGPSSLRCKRPGTWSAHGRRHLHPGTPEPRRGAQTRAHPGAIPLITGVIDGWPDVSYRMRNQIATELVATGMRVTDHVISLPREITLTGNKSTLQMGVAGPAQAFQALEHLAVAKVPTTLVTEWATIVNTVAGALGLIAVIPPRVHRQDRDTIAFDRETYKARHRIANVLADRKPCRGIANRTCKLAATFTGLRDRVAWFLGIRRTVQLLPADAVTDRTRAPAGITDDGFWPPRGQGGVGPGRRHDGPSHTYRSKVQSKCPGDGDGRPRSRAVRRTRTPRATRTDWGRS